MPEENEYSPFGSYVLLRRIAKGDLTEFYLAVPADTERAYERLVIKRLLPEYADSQDHVAYFLREAKLTAQLIHPNISRVIEVGRHEGQPFMALEHLDGRDLDLLIRLRRSMLKPPVAAYICGRVCAALDYLHGATGVSGSSFGVVHGNLTPENILVGGQGEVKLIDFGSARTGPEPVAAPKGAARGKLPPLPPQLEGAGLDGRADLFALGAVLYEATTGAKVDHEPAHPSQLVPNYPPELARIVMRALARDPSGCFSSAAEMQDALEEFLRPFGKEQTELPLASLVEAKPIGARPQSQPQRRPAATVDGDGIVDERVETKIKALSDIVPPRKPLRPQGVNVAEEANEETGLLPSLLDSDDRAGADDQEETGLLPSLSLPEAAPEREADEQAETGLLPALDAEPPPAAPAPRADANDEVDGEDPREAGLRPPGSTGARVDGTGPNDWDAVTASHEDAADLVARAMAQQPADLPANPPDTPPPARHARLFGAVLKGSALAALILASAFIARVGTIAEIRQQLAAKHGPGPTKPAAAVADGDRATPDEPARAAAGEAAVAAATADAGATAEVAVAAEPEADAGQAAAPPAVPVEAASETAVPVEAEGVKKAEASPARTGFGVIVVQGRGKLFIDGKPCRAPCAVKVSAGEHEVSSKGSRPFKRQIIVEAGAKEIVTVR